MKSIEVVSGQAWLSVDGKKLDLLSLQRTPSPPPYTQDGNLFVPLTPFCLAVGYPEDSIIASPGESQVTILGLQGSVIQFSDRQAVFTFNGSTIPIVNESGASVRSANLSGVLQVYSRSIARAFGFTIAPGDSGNSIVYLADTIP